jgi:hypothetical protein
VLGQFGGAIRTTAALLDARVLAPAVGGLAIGLLLFTPSRPARTIGLLGLLGGIGLAAWNLFRIATAEQRAGALERTVERAAALPERGARAVVSAIEEAERAARGDVVQAAGASDRPILRYLDTVVEKLDGGVTPTPREKSFLIKLLDSERERLEAIRKLEAEGIPHEVEPTNPLILRRARALLGWIEALEDGRTPSPLNLRNAGSRLVPATGPLSGEDIPGNLCTRTAAGWTEVLRNGSPAWRAGRRALGD